ncbi:MAG: gamma carbonic anhydrase family protein [Pyrinomonas sp.]|uniref:gamma carbonic anhydrase family protein n=1 Tax=Pyrinomonas sp. TaxID=2080306 RepID=UPI00331B922B
MIETFLGKRPRIHPSAFIADSADIIGDVEIGEEASVWFRVVVRGDVNSVRIGARANVQDGAVIHVTRGLHPTFIEDEVTIGHGAMVHGCRIERGCLIGIGAIVLDGALIGAESLIAAGALVTPGTSVPPRSLVMGAPARVVRPLKQEELVRLERYWKNYVEYAKIYRRNVARYDARQTEGESESR